MGPIDSPPIPMEWRERPQSPAGHKQFGLKLIGCKKQDGTDAIYWAPTYDGCLEAAKLDGWKL